ncbi:hypothetical protein EDC56_1107 [Sinobacterium caligoides]|uniref:Uncharacterized protein n=1 Tax=Sinobacterium caligoides TaxID=933926 RepID=A0A3N2E0E9_9GAMM|nr:hypothetical protein [Sinobacterium caligoides]ROS05570.1 hypothetical protein EDC56_1107 [Sinobacterium caligoides]
MMNFNEYNQPSKILVLHYAKILNCDLAREIACGNSDLSSKKEAEILAYFFWQMTDQAAIDENEGKVIDGIADLQSWLQKALYIFAGYFKRQGYEVVWSEGYDQYHQ